ncbi:hypothetical protein [Cetobacterium sp. SF1]|uniref:hypothetical protein n=1 Tax=unclassified Cetobacterium TaxID=2630983 RepID=UPI003CFAFC8B
MKYAIVIFCFFIAACSNTSEKPNNLSTGKLYSLITDVDYDNEFFDGIPDTIPPEEFEEYSL